MNIADIYNDILFLFRKLIFEVLHSSYRWHPMLANMYEFIIKTFIYLYLHSIPWGHWNEYFWQLRYHIFSHQIVKAFMCIF